MTQDSIARSTNKFTQLSRQHWIIIGVFVVLALLIGSVAFEGHNRTVVLLMRIDNLSAQNDALSGQLVDLTTYIEFVETGFASTTSILEEDIIDTQDSFTVALLQEQKTVTEIKEEFGSVQDEVSQISGTVTTLEKLSKIDPELLQKYSKVFFLNEHYEPARLVEIPEKYNYNNNKSFLVHEKVWPLLESMLLEAQSDGVEVYVFSAYRSFGAQEALKGQYTIIYGEGAANQFSADQGYSEHQLGTTVDVITTGIGGTLFGLEHTDAYAWFLSNAHRYGFILSYPKDNEFYIFEPWHWRFVGVELASVLYDTDKHFYDLDQREIDEYLVSLFN